jgi:[ribosomal protein S18]-alanine N-acetyltransferase
MKKRKNDGPHIRWMIRSDCKEVLAIEKESFEFAWDETELINCLRQRNCIGMVVEANDEICGFMVYELHKNRLHILNFAVAEKYRRNGYGSAMVEKLVSKLSYQRRSRIVLEVRETNLVALNFFKSQGFRAVSLLKDFYEETTDDAIVMVYKVNQEVECLG